MKKNSSSQQFFWLWYAHIIFESLPISSSTHVDLLNGLLSKIYKQPKIAINTVTNYLMHIPTAVVIALFLFAHGFPLLEHTSLADIIQWFIMALIADACTGICYFIFTEKRTAKWPVWLGVLISALLLFSLYFVNYSTYLAHYSTKCINVDQLHWQNVNLVQAIIIGLMQGISLLPGISRLASTVVPGIWLGLNPLTSMLFSLTIELGLLLAAFMKAFCLIVKRKEQNMILSKLSNNTALSTASSVAISTLLSYIVLEGVFVLFCTPIGLSFIGTYLLILAFFLTRH